MTEDLRNTGAHETETPRDTQTLAEVVGLLGQFTEDHPWNSQHAEAIIENRLGRVIQVLIQNHFLMIRECMIVSPQGRVNISNDVELDFGTFELYDRSPSRVGHGERYRGPQGPRAWFRNYQGILDQVSRLG